MEAGENLCGRHGCDFTCVGISDAASNFLLPSRLGSGVQFRLPATEQTMGKSDALIGGQNKGALGESNEGGSHFHSIINAKPDVEPLSDPGQAKRRIYPQTATKKQACGGRRCSRFPHAKLSGDHKE